MNDKEKRYNEILLIIFWVVAIALSFDKGNIYMALVHIFFMIRRYFKQISQYIKERLLSK